MVNTNVVSILVNANGWEDYTDGVYDDPTACAGDINHAVNAVGYGYDSTESKDYWIVKNTWGTTFGESGFIRILREDSESAGICNVCVLGL